MARPDHIEGLAIVSADHMIADATGVQPDTLKPEADQRFFHGELAKADAVAHGRHSAEGGPDAALRRRLILTRRTPGIARDPENKLAIHWNPDGAPLEQAWDALGLRGGTLMVIGGTEAFGLFLRLGYDTFHLTRSAHVRLPGGRTVFPAIPPETPETLLAGHGLNPGPARVLEPSAGLTLVTWKR
jgi:YD repeat-containing protein